WQLLVGWPDLAGFVARGAADSAALLRRRDVVGWPQLATGSAGDGARTPAHGLRVRPDVFRVMLAGGVAALLAAPSAAIASPSPSPALDSVLATPVTSDYIQYSKAFMTVQGDFNVLEYVSFLAPADPSGTQTTLKHDGFVTGLDRKSTSELQSLAYLVCRLLLEKKK